MAGSSSGATSRGASERSTTQRGKQGGLCFGYENGGFHPDATFDQIERLAKREGRSRSEVYSAALREYVTRHAPDEVTAAMNRVCDEVAGDADTFATVAGKRVLAHVDW